MIRPRQFTAPSLAAALLVFPACDHAPVTSPVTSAVDAEPIAAAHRGAGPATEAGPQKFTHTTARETICTMIDPGETWQSGQKTHFRGRVVETRAVSDDPRYTGSNLSTFSGWQDAGGNGKGHGRVVFQPDDIDGTWEGGFSGGWSEGLFNGRGRVHGTGALRGQTLHVGIQEVVLGPDDPRHPCKPALPHGPQFEVTVRIIDPGA